MPENKPYLEVHSRRVDSDAVDTFLARHLVAAVDENQSDMAELAVGRPRILIAQQALKNVYSMK